MSERPSLFLSYAEADRQFGERLHASLERHGCIVHDPANGSSNADSGARIEDAARGSDHFVLLFGRHRGRDRWQEQEWQVALEESWEHPDKRMIPVLLRDAELPSFVRSAAAATGDTVGLHVHGLRDVEEAAEVIARNARAEEAPVLRGASRSTQGRADLKDTGLRAYSVSADDLGADEPGHELSFIVEPATPEERSARFSDIERYADELEL